MTRQLLLSLSVRVYLGQTASTGGQPLQSLSLQVGPNKPALHTGEGGAGPAVVTPQLGELDTLIVSVTFLREVAI